MFMASLRKVVTIIFAFVCAWAVPVAFGVPVITAFSPSSGAVGTSVTITGTNFSSIASSNIVYFGAVKANITSASSNSLLVTTPPGVTFAPVTVTVGGLTAFSGKLFLPTFPGGSPINSSSLAPRVNLSGGNDPGRVAFGDLDGDGKPDVVVANVYDGSIWVYRNISTNGTLATASFAPPATFFIGGGVDSQYGLALADLDGDGRLDIVTANRQLNTLSIFQNLSSSGSLTTNSFGTRVDISIPGGPNGVAVSDLDGDGKPEIVTANIYNSTVSILRNIGTGGTITPASFASPVNIAVGSGPSVVVISDLDGDGKADIATANASLSRKVSVLRNISTVGSISAGSFASVVDLPGSDTGETMAIGDLDGDGKPDVVVGSYTGQTICVYRNISTSGTITTNSFATNVVFAAGARVHTVAIGDVDGDGKPDLAIVTQGPDMLSLFRNQSAAGSFTVGSLGSRVDFGSGNNPVGIAIGDLDADGRPDVAIGNSFDNTVSLYHNMVPVVLNCVAPPAGLVSWWRGESNALDVVGINNGSLLGPVGFAAGEVGQAFRLTNASAYVDVPTSASLNVGTGNGFSIELWINPSDVSVQHPLTEWGHDSQTQTLGPFLWISVGLGGGVGGPGNLLANVVDTGNASHILYSTNGLIQTNMFQHVALTYDKTTGNAVLYCNGAVVAAANLGIFTPKTTSNLLFGHRGATGETFPGILDDISLYNRVLTQNEIQSIYNASSAGKCFIPAPPAIVNQPANQTVFVGQSAVFSVTVTGTPPFNYQWRSNSVGIPGATSATLVLNNVQLNQNGSFYSVTVANEGGVTNSANALLTVNQPTCVTPPAGLVSWWRGESNAVDAVDGNNGTLQGSVGFAAGEVGRAFRLTNASAYVRVPASASLNVGTGNGFTMELWINPTNVSVQHPMTEWGIDGQTQTLGPFLWISVSLGGGQGGPGNLLANIVDTGNASHILYSTNGLIQTNMFQHVALTYDKTTGNAVLYCNGAVVAAANLGIFTPKTTSDLLFGHRMATGETFPGILDDISLYNRALTQNEIQSIYNASSAGKCVSAQPPTCTPPPAGLVSWWRAENNALDVSGINNGILDGTVGFAAGETGQAFLFNTLNADVKIPASASLNLGSGTGFTLEAWIYPSNTAALGPLFEWNDGVGDWGVHFYVSPSGMLYANIVDSGGGWHIFNSAGGVVASNVFQHVALTYNKGTGVATIYCNGAVVAQQNLGGFTPLTTYDLYLGRRVSGPVPSEVYTFSGRIDEAAIYNRALLANEIQSIYNAGTTGKCVPPPPLSCSSPAAGLVSWWRAESNALDVAGVNNGFLDGTIGFAPGEVGQAFQFNTINADVKIPASASLNLGSSNGFTLETWIYPSNTVALGPLFEWNNNGGSWGVHFYVNPSGVLYANIVDSSGGWHQISSPAGVVASNVFQHVALTYNKTTGVATIYRNGAVVAQQNLGGFTPLTTYDLYLGRRVSGPVPAEVYTFAGKIDEAAIYNRALTQGEIQSIYNASTVGKCVPPPPPSCSSPSTGLVSWWRGESNALDVVGINNGILDGTIGFATGEVGQAFLFNTLNADVKVPASASLNVGLSSGLTIETWINPASATARQPIAEWNDGGGAWGVHFWVSPEGAGQLYANIVDTGGTWHQINTASGTITSNIFQHVAVTYNKSSGVATLYRNGVIVAQANLGVFTPLTTYDLYLGRRVSGAPGDTGTFAGLMDELALYNRALTQSEIQSIYNADGLGKCVPRLWCVPDAITTPTNTPTKFSAAKLAVNDVDLDGYALTVIGVSAGSAQGGTVTLASGQLTYTPPVNFSGNDSFTYTISDGHGGTAIGTVTATVGSSPVSLNIVFGPTMVSGNFVVRFAGIPGQTYTIEAASSLAGPWTKVANLAAPTTDQGFGVGVFQFSEPVGGNTTRFYRTVYPAY